MKMLFLVCVALFATFIKICRGVPSPWSNIQSCYLPEDTETDSVNSDFSVRSDATHSLFISPCGEQLEMSVDDIRDLLETQGGREEFQRHMQSLNETAAVLLEKLEHIRSDIRENNVLFAQFRDAVERNAGEQSFFQFPEHSESDADYTRWLAVLVNLFRALSKVYAHVDITSQYFSRTPIPGLASLRGDFQIADEAVLQLLCGIHDGLRTLHEHQDQNIHSWTHWAANHANSTHTDLTKLDSIRQQFGDGVLNSRAFFLCGFHLCINTVRDVQSGFQWMGNQLSQQIPGVDVVSS